MCRVDSLRAAIVMRTACSAPRSKVLQSVLRCNGLQSVLRCGRQACRSALLAAPHRDMLRDAPRCCSRLRYTSGCNAALKSSTLIIPLCRCTLLCYEVLLASMRRELPCPTSVVPPAAKGYELHYNCGELRHAAVTCCEL